MRTIYLFIIGILLMACEQPQQESDTQAAAHCLEAAEVALANESRGQVFDSLLQWSSYYLHAL